MHEEHALTLVFHCRVKNRVKSQSVAKATIRYLQVERTAFADECSSQRRRGKEITSVCRKNDEDYTTEET
jgi:hypothetical protein